MPNRLTTGTIKSLKTEKGFGFIVAGSVEYFFHAQDLVEGADSFHALTLGQSVSFQPTTTPKGPRANNVEVEGE